MNFYPKHHHILMDFHASLAYIVIMNKKVLKTLEYDKITSLLSKRATCNAGRDKCLSLRPLDKKEDIEKLLNETEAALNRILKYGHFSVSGACDPAEYAPVLEKGGTLSAGELLRIAALITVSEACASYAANGREPVNDCLSTHFEAIVPLSDLRRTITKAIISEDEIADDASAELKNIRRELRIGGDRIRSKLNEMLSSSIRDCLMEPIITSRQGRYCLPVKAEYKSRVPGLVHDQSGSGATLFIEPLAVVELNNNLRELALSENEEIRRILAELSAEVAKQLPFLKESFYHISELDFIFARAAYSLDINAVRPKLNTDGRLNLRRARHPLLEPDSVVPIDVSLGTDFKLLIITGPNTGGKTVSLKTVGLLQLMGQSGLFIPAGDNSSLSVFSEIYADIGDEQSIEQSLSTISSHIKNIIYILKRTTGHKSLVLLDELCAGTDPIEGAALATAILDKLKNDDVRVMATTHYSELKEYALSTAEVENACCEFDVSTLSPTYKLLIGVPGKSNAFAISEKLGLSHELVEDARSRISEEQRSMEELMLKLEESRAEIEKDKAAISEERRRAEQARKDISDRQEKLRLQRDQILQEANEKASNILRDAKNTADAAIRSLNKYGSADADISKLEKTRGNLGKKLSHTQSESVKRSDPNRGKHKKVRPEDIHIGDKVRVISLNITGTVHTLPNDRGELNVHMGILNSDVKLSDIELIPEENPYSDKSRGGLRKKVSREGSSGNSGGTHYSSFGKAATISPEIQLIGMTTDEAIVVLDKYLDDAYLAHLSPVRVVHGKGTGALRKAVNEYLRRNPHVVSHRLGEFGEGDAGVTIVELKTE